MGLAELALLLSVVFNWWQWGEIKETKLERDIAREYASQCTEAKEDARQIERENADDREEAQERIGRIVARSEFDIRRAHETRTVVDGSVDCAVMDNPSGSIRMEAIIRRTDEINKALRPARTSSDSKRSAQSYPDPER